MVKPKSDSPVYKDQVANGKVRDFFDRDQVSQIKCAHCGKVLADESGRAKCVKCGSWVCPRGCKKCTGKKFDPKNN